MQELQTRSEDARAKWPAATKEDRVWTPATLAHRHSSSRTIAYDRAWGRGPNTLISLS